MKICPACGHPLPTDEVLFDLNKLQLKIFVIVKRAGRAGIEHNAIVERLYSDRSDGGPASASNIVYQQTSLLNKKLIKHGLRILAHRGTVRRLEKI